jgi:polyisoprenyl-phosphate glycosyltransferase
VPQRAAGNTQWRFGALAAYAWRNLTSFSSVPLQLVTLLGAVGLCIGLVLACKAIVDKVSGVALDGFSTVILLSVIFNSLILLALGIIGSYVARIYEEIKARPVYVLRDSLEDKPLAGPLA